MSTEETTLSEEERELERLREVASRTSILTPEKQRALWSKVIALKTLLVRRGIATAAEIDELERKAREGLDEQVLKKVRRSLGVYAPPDYEETVEEEADRITDCEP